jgi:Flp pilus assembly secretin CpaC
MTKKSGTWLSLISFGLVLCLAFPACRTSEEKVSDAKELSTSTDVVRNVTQKLKRITIPEMTFYPPATLVDALDFLKAASIDYDDPNIPLDQRGVGCILHLPVKSLSVAGESADVFKMAYTYTNFVPKIAAMSVRFISLYDAYNLVCEATDMEWLITGGKIVIRPKGTGDEDWVTKVYNVPQALIDHLCEENSVREFPDDSDKVWEDFFKQLGVMEPACAKVHNLPAIGKVRVTNTPENMDLIEKVFQYFATRMIEVEIQIHAYRVADIERLRLEGGVSLDSLHALSSQGKSTAVAKASALTKSGQEALVKAVQEVRYPTELKVSQASSNRTVGNGTQSLTPASFETRETGLIFQVLPEIIEWERTCINLSILPQRISLEGWESFPADWLSRGMSKAVEFKQPVFGVTSFETQAYVKDGQTIVLGSASTPDGEWVQVGFLTARLQDVDPDPLVCRKDASKALDEPKNAAVFKKLKTIIVPELRSRFPHNITIIDVVRSLKASSIQYDESGAPKSERGIDFIVKLPASFWEQKSSSTNADISAEFDIFDEPESETNGIPCIPSTVCRILTLYDALKLVCDISGMEFEIRDGIVWIKPVSQYAELYHLPSILSFSEQNGTNQNVSTNLTCEQQLKRYLESMGLWWLTGASNQFYSVRYIPPINMWYIKDNRYFHNNFKDIIKADCFNPVLIEADLQIHAFPMGEIEQMRRLGKVSVEGLNGLRRKGLSKTVSSATILTKSGQEAVVKSVREVIYPTEVLTDSGQTGSNVTAQAVTQALVPGEFETREAGMILSVTPELSATEQCQIQVKVNPTWVTHEGWQSFSATQRAGGVHSTLSIKQPKFGVKCFETETILKNGETILLGTSSSSDNKWVNVAFLTVKLKTISGDLVKHEKK